MSESYFFNGNEIGKPSSWMGKSFTDGNFWYKVFSDEKACKREAEMLQCASAICKEGIVKIENNGELHIQGEDGSETKLYAIQEELVDGLVFKSYVETHHDEDEGAAFFKELADLLSELYNNGNGILHNDIQPKNVFIRSNGKPVLIDFGISKKVKEPLQEFHYNVTEFFSSPEKKQRGAHPVSVSGDIFSFGKMMKFYMDWNPNRGAASYSKEFRAIYNKCVEREYSSFEDVAADLNEMLQRKETLQEDDQANETHRLKWSIKELVPKLFPGLPTFLYIVSACLLIYAIVLIFFK